MLSKKREESRQHRLSGHCLFGPATEARGCEIMRLTLLSGGAAIRAAWKRQHEREQRPRVAAWPSAVWSPHPQLVSSWSRGSIPSRGEGQGPSPEVWRRWSGTQPV